MDYCPFTLLCDYVNYRSRFKHEHEPFFVFRDNSPVKPEQMRHMLKTVISKSGFDAYYYEVHGLRTGRASDLLKMGVSVETIKKLGRWKSNTVFTYLHTL